MRRNVGRIGRINTKVGKINGKVIGRDNGRGNKEEIKKSITDKVGIVGRRNKRKNGNIIGEGVDIKVVVINKGGVIRGRVNKDVGINDVDINGEGRTVKVLDDNFGTDGIVKVSIL